MIESSRKALLVLLFVILGLVLGCGQTPTTSAGPVSRYDKIPSGAVKITSEADVSAPILHSSEFEEPIPIPGSVNSAGAEDSPFILPDGNTLYLFFTPDVTVSAVGQLTDEVTGIYVSKKAGGLWGEPERVVLQDVGKLALDGAEFVQGDTMWFASAREGYTGINFFTAEYAGGKWQNWQYAGDRLNVDYHIGEMTLSPTGEILYFHSNRSGGQGGLDIWLTRRSGSDWLTPECVPTVNSAGDESRPFVTPDGQELWFTRTYQGTPAVYRSKMSGGTWGVPELIVSQFAGEPTLDSAGNLYFVHHFYNSNVMIEADIYVAYKK